MRKKRNLIQYDITKILKTGKHWLVRCSGKTQAIDYIRKELENNAAITFVISVHQQRPYHQPYHCKK